jgi:hypothetical protein
MRTIASKLAPTPPTWGWRVYPPSGDGSAAVADPATGPTVAPPRDMSNESRLGGEAL